MCDTNGARTRNQGQTVIKPLTTQEVTLFEGRLRFFQNVHCKPYGNDYKKFLKIYK